MKTPDEEKFKETVNSVPNLCMSGLVNNAYCKHFDFEMNQNKERLLECYNEFKLCCEWLSKCKLNQTATFKSPNSYGLKHLVENHSKTYISNGALIAAVIFLGIPYKPHTDPPNISVGVSKACPFYKEQIVR